MNNVELDNRAAQIICTLMDSGVSVTDNHGEILNDPAVLALYGIDSVADAEAINFIRQRIEYIEKQPVVFELEGVKFRSDMKTFKDIQRFASNDDRVGIQTLMMFGFVYGTIVPFE